MMPIIELRSPWGRREPPEGREVLLRHLLICLDYYMAFKVESIFVLNILIVAPLSDPFSSQRSSSL